MKIAIHGKPFEEESASTILSIFKLLEDNNVEIALSKKYQEILTKKGFKLKQHHIFLSSEQIRDYDAMITLGGDGTLLEAVTYVEDTSLPILAINMGRLGFLATTAREDAIGGVKALLNKKFTIDERSLIELTSKNKDFGKQNFALNDFAILKKDTSSMIVVNAYINDEFLNSYWADGIIVSTPTGSTGYSISCGGPLVLPYSENFVLTPVSAHNLTVRPIVVPDSSILSFTIEGRSDNFLVSLDSRLTVVDDNVKLTVKKAPFTIKLIQLTGNNYFKTLRQKLNWGLDIRN